MLLDSGWEDQGFSDPAVRLFGPLSQAPTAQPTQPTVSALSPRLLSKFVCLDRENHWSATPTQGPTILFLILRDDSETHSSTQNIAPICRNQKVVDLSDNSERPVPPDSTFAIPNSPWDQHHYRPQHRSSHIAHPNHSNNRANCRRQTTEDLHIAFHISEHSPLSPPSSPFVLLLDTSAVW
jgi:hypothetical protein